MSASLMSPTESPPCGSWATPPLTVTLSSAPSAHSLQAAVARRMRSATASACVQFGMWQHDRQLGVFITRGHVQVRPHGRANDLRDGPQHDVSDQLSVRPVQAPELIEIQQHETERLAAQVVFGNAMPQGLEEAAAVQQARQRVGIGIGGLRLQLPGQRLKLLRAEIDPIARSAGLGRNGFAPGPVVQVPRGCARLARGRRRSERPLDERLGVVAGQRFGHAFADGDLDGRFLHAELAAFDRAAQARSAACLAPPRCVLGNITAN